LLAVLEGKPPFEELYGAFLQRVYAYVRAQLGGSADAEDVTSQVFIKAWEAYPRFEPQGATPSAWLFRIARNATLDHLRSSGRRDRLVRVVANEPEPVTDPSEVAREHIEYGQLMELVAELPERQREVIALRHSGLSFLEVGELIGSSEDAAKMQYHRALRVLRDRARERGLA
jgi:RNA polymerase sigma-70 factor (ECF subfamily)